MATTIKNAMEQLAIAVIKDFKNTKRNILGDDVSVAFNTLAKIENFVKNLKIESGGETIIINDGDEIFLDEDLVKMYEAAKL